MPTGFRQPISRRGFLTVGTIGLRPDPGRLLPAPGPRRPEELRADRGQGRLGHPHLPARRHRPPGDVRPQAVRPDRVPRRAGHDPDQDRRRVVQRDPAADRPGRRQDHRHPLDDPRRGGPRARHAQHVHRLPAQPGAAVSRAWAASSPTSTARGTTCRRTSASRAMPNDYAGTGYLSSAFSPFSLGSRPGRRRLPGPGPEPARAAIDELAVRHPPERPRRGQRPLRQEGEERRPGGDGHLLPAGLQPDQLAEGPRGVQHRRRARQDPRRVRPQRRRPADADGPPAGRGRRPVRHRSVRRLGHARRDRQRHAEPDARLRPGVRRPDPRPRPDRPARPDARHGLQRVRPHARRSTRTPAATTGRRSSASSWPAAASRRATSTAPRTPPPPSPSATRSAPRTWPRPSTTSSASSPTRS